jgi:hypothetical protein
VFPKEFRGLLNMERRVVVVERPELALVIEWLYWNRETIETDKCSWRIREFSWIVLKVK